jgi:hypothetical protein
LEQRFLDFIDQRIKFEKDGEVIHFSFNLPFQILVKRLPKSFIVISNQPNKFQLPVEHVEDRKALKQEVDLDDHFDYSKLESSLLDSKECLALFMAAKIEQVSWIVLLGRKLTFNRRKAR